MTDHQTPEYQLSRLRVQLVDNKAELRYLAHKLRQATDKGLDTTKLKARLIEVKAMIKDNEHQIHLKEQDNS